MFGHRWNKSAFRNKGLLWLGHKGFRGYTLHDLHVGVRSYIGVISDTYYQN